MRHALALLAAAALAAPAAAQRIVVGHDVNTLGSFVAGANELQFAVNVAGWLTAGDATRRLLLYESNPGDGTRDFAPGVISALSGAGFDVTVTPDYTTPFAGFDAVFVAADFPATGFLDNAALRGFVDAGGGVYLAGGVLLDATAEAAGWNAFLGGFGLALAPSYNGFTVVPITSAHPIFAGVTSLRAENGQSILDLGTNPNAQLVQLANGQGVYAVANAASAVPEPATAALLLAGVLPLLVPATRRRAVTPAAASRSSSRG
jgi:hypothetical protein